MLDFIFYSILWALALYGLLDIIKLLFYMFTHVKLNKNGMILILAVKNQEKHIEGFCRSVLFRFLAGNKDYSNSIRITDLNSSDKTKDIVKKLAQDYQCLEVEEWEECKKEIDSLFNK